MYPIEVDLKCGICGKVTTVIVGTDDKYYYIDTPTDGEDDMDEEVETLSDIADYAGYKHKHIDGPRFCLLCGDCQTKIIKMEIDLEEEKQKQLAAMIRKVVKSGR